MKGYSVIITETLKKIVYVEAENKEQAIEKTETDWFNGIHILDADNFNGVSFSVEEEHTPIDKKIIE